jgi:hypothetical protein
MKDGKLKRKVLHVKEYLVISFLQRRLYRPAQTHLKCEATLPYAVLVNPRTLVLTVLASETGAASEK